MTAAGIAIVRTLEFELWESRTPDELEKFVAAIYQAMCSSSENGNVEPV